MTPKSDRAPGQRGATEQTGNFSATSVTRPPDATVWTDDVRRERLRAAALWAHYREKVTRMPPEAKDELRAKASEVAKLKPWKKPETPVAEAPVIVPTPTAPTDDLPVEAADTPHYRAERPPGRRSQREEVQAK